MKKFISIVGMVAGLIIGLLGAMVTNKFALQLGLSGIAKNIFFILGTVPGIVIVFIFEGDYSANIRKLKLFFSTKSVSSWIARIAWCLVIFVAAILEVGNLSGNFVTIRYAGEILLLFAFVVSIAIAYIIPKK